MAETRPKHKIRIIRNAARCNHCGDVIESTYRHDFKTCSCLYYFCPEDEVLSSFFFST